MIAITGAAGFIGSNLARRLADMDLGPLVLVDHLLTPERVGNVYVSDLGSSRFVDHLAFLEEIGRDALDLSTVFHLGACSDTTEGDWGYLLRNNVEYSQRLWRHCARRGVPFVYASSAATYGDGSDGFDDRTPPDRLRPLNLYGRSKNEFDRWALDQAARGEPTPRGWAGLKFFNVYGPRERHKGRMASMVWQSYRQIQTRGEVGLFRSDDPAYPDGGQLRDFVHVDDCLDHMIWLWRNPQVCGLFNSGTGRARSFLDLVSATFAALGLEPRVAFVEMPDDLRGRYQNYTQAEMAKLRAAGYPERPTPLEEGVSRYL